MTAAVVTAPAMAILPPIGAGQAVTSAAQPLTLANRDAFPIVTGRSRRSGGLGPAAGVGVALLLGIVALVSMTGHRAVRLEAPAARPMPRVGAGVRPPPQPIAPAPPSGGLLLPAVPSVPVPVPPPAGPAPILVFDAGAPIASGTARSAAPVPPSATDGNDDDRFAARVGSGDIPRSGARALTAPATTIVQGTLIAAVLETAIDTDLPGYVRAVVSRDVLAFDGRHVLIPRSSRLIGQYKSGLQAGHTRAYIVWSRLIRPDGASIALGSPGVGQDGTTGIPGRVDGHFMKRFGSAALLTVVGGLGAIGGSGAAVALQGGSQGAATVAAQRDTGIAPTVRVAQGEPVRVFIARDLDFSAVAPVLADR